MKMPPPRIRSRRAFTLIEITIVIMVLLALIKIGLFTSEKMEEWKLGRAASETLRSVYSAQRMYLADHPTAAVGTLDAETVVPYLPNKSTELPTVKSLEGEDLEILVNVSPPVIADGSGGSYDPSGSNNDSLWDVGE